MVILVRMSHGCFKCKRAPTFRSRNLVCCADCFIEGWKKKVGKQFGHIKYNSNVLVVLPSAGLSEACKIIASNEIRATKNIQFRDKTSFLCELPDTSLINQISAFDGINDFDFVVIFKTIDRIVLQALEAICSGDGKGAVELAARNTVGTKTCLINPLCEVSNKELAYWLYLNNIRYSASRESTKKEEVLSEFIDNVMDKNSLVLYNIINVLNKMYKLMDDSL